MKIRDIAFSFENTEQITIGGKYIGDFLIQDIEKRIQRTACNSIDEIEIAHTFMIEIHKDANVEYIPFGFLEKDKMKVFDRFQQCMDVTDIEFSMYNAYGNKLTESYKIRTYWQGDNDHFNEAQCVYVSRCGHMYLIISDSKMLSDLFNIEDIENQIEMNRKFSMYDYGGVENV